MNFSQRRDSKGFTLIEMSIVLVIIGLIVGGILKGQELIESSRQKNLTSQIDRIRAGVTSFIDRYNALPGDYGAAAANINASMGDGNRSGAVTVVAAGTPYATNAAMIAVDGTAAGETREFWNHLIGAGLITGGRVLDDATATAANSVCGEAIPNPATNYPNSCMSLAFGTHDGLTTGGNAVTAHWLYIFNGVAGAPNQANSTGIMNGQNAFFWDSKYDDGQAGDGGIRTTLESTGAGCGLVDGTNYTTTATAAACDFAINLF